jgi:hypothetical protein
MGSTGEEAGWIAAGLNAVQKNVRKCLQARSFVIDISLNEAISATRSQGSRIMSLGLTRHKSNCTQKARHGFNIRNRTMFQLAMQEKLLKKHVEDFRS